MADLASETSRAAKAAVRNRLHNYRCWKHSPLTMHQHQRKQDSNDRRRKDMGHKLDKTKQVKYTNRNPLTLPWGVLPPSWTPFFGPCFPCPLFGFWSVPWFLPCFGSFVSFLSGCASAFCFAVDFSAASVCLLWCCWVFVFAEVAPLPRWLPPSPPPVVPLRRPGPVTVLVPPSGYLVASCDGPVALP